MTAKTRRRILVAAVAVLLTLPAEAIFLKAIGTADQDLAAQTWVSGQTEDQLESFATTIQSYPFSYRRAIMKAISPDLRSRVWRGHIAAFIKQHPALDADTIALLQAAAAAATPEALSAPTDDTRAQIGWVANQIKARLGKDVADYLFYRLGPADGTFVSALPVAEKLTNFVRQSLVVRADFHDDCDCNLDFGCTGLLIACVDGTGCVPDYEWPACGLLWEYTCNGVCKFVSIWGGI